MNSDNNFEPRSLSASEYVLKLFEPADRTAILVRNRSTGQDGPAHRDGRNNRGAAIFKRGSRTQNARGSDVFIGMNPLRDDAHSRTKSNIKDIRHVYLDLDRDGDHVSRTRFEFNRMFRHPISSSTLRRASIRSSGKLAESVRIEAESLLRSLANQFDGDPAATDSTRVLRLPGFANRKLTEEFVVQARHESDAVYALRDFAIEEDSPDATRQIGGAHREPHDRTRHHKSQSERDWAYAKRALARGDDFEEVVIRTIADFRFDDKPSPESYARRTVTKARAELDLEPFKSQ